MGSCIRLATAVVMVTRLIFLPCQVLGVQFYRYLFVHLFLVHLVLYVPACCSETHFLTYIFSAPTLPGGEGTNKYLWSMWRC